jgi:hypothetical protein
LKRLKRDRPDLAAKVVAGARAIMVQRLHQSLLETKDN